MTSIAVAIFGANHIIAVLRGEKTEGVLRHGHDRLRTFSVGAEHAAPYWRGLIRQLIAMRALDVDTEGHGGLFLVEEEARPILRGEISVTLRQDTPRPARKAASGEGMREPAPAPISDAASASLFEALRLWRLAEAKGQGIPPYVIFHDSVLREIAATRPTSLDALGQIKGVGASKLERYGSRVLGVVSTAVPGSAGR